MSVKSNSTAIPMCSQVRFFFQFKFKNSTLSFSQRSNTAGAMMMEPWQQQVLAGLRARHALYVDSVQDVMGGYLHLSRLFQAQTDKNDQLRAKSAALEAELQALRDYRSMRERAPDASDMERALTRKVDALDAAHKEAQAQAQTLRDQLAEAKARAFDLRSAEERLALLLEKEQAAHGKTRDSLVEEVTALRKTTEELTAKQRDSSTTIDKLRADLAMAQEDVKALAEEKFRLQSQLFSSAARNQLQQQQNAAQAAAAAAGASPEGGVSEGSAGESGGKSPSGGAASGADDIERLPPGAARVPVGPRFILQDAHASEVSSVCFSEGGHRLFSGGPDRTIRMWDVATGRPTAKHPTSAIVMCLDSKGQYLVTGLSDNTCRLHILSSAAGLRSKCQFTSHTDSVDAAYLSLDCERVYSASRDCTIRCWNVGRESLSHTTMCTSTACDIAVHSSVIASAHKDRSVRLWDARTGRIAGECAALHDSVVTSVRFLNDGRFTVSLSRDNTARVCDVRTLREVEKFSHEKLLVASNSMRLCTSPDDVYVAFPTAEGSVLVWEPRASKTTVVKGGHTGLVNSVAWSDDGRTIATGGVDKKVVMWT